MTVFGDVRSPNGDRGAMLCYQPLSRVERIGLNITARSSKNFDEPIRLLSASSPIGAEASPRSLLTVVSSASPSLQGSGCRSLTGRVTTACDALIAAWIAVLSNSEEDPNAEDQTLLPFVCVGIGSGCALCTTGCRRIKYPQLLTSLLGTCKSAGEALRLTPRREV
jgi:hypothetical protein